MDKEQQHWDFNLKDKRVDRVVKKHGFADAMIYYSPIKLWLFMLALLFIPVGVYFYPVIIHYWYLFVLYLVLSYLLNAYRNSSFALTDQELVVINSNFPFRQITVYPLKDIEKIKIDRQRLHWILVTLCILSGCNYVKITTAAGTKTFFCAGLQYDDPFSRSFTEHTIDQLERQLADKGVPTRISNDVE